MSSSKKNKFYKSILIIYTGGTIGMVQDAQGVLIPFDSSLIFEQIPTLKLLPVSINIISFDQVIDSSNVDPSHWKKIAKIITDNQNHDGYVVLHGTDTMSFSASALSFMLENLNRPIVFTGSQLPLTSFRSDARENLITAIEIAIDTINGRPTVPEVSIYFNSLLLRANRSKKVESNDFDAFVSVNYPPLAEAGVEINYNHHNILKPKKNAKITLHDKFETNISVLKLFPGISKQYVQSILNIKGLRGVVMETYGSGNAPTYNWFLKCLEDAIDRNIIIFNITQCLGGKVYLGRYQTSESLKKIGVIGGSDITLESAITKMMIVLAEKTELPDIKLSLIKPMSGELT